MTDSLDLDGERVVVVGLGLSGRAAARFLVQRGASVVGNDAREHVEDADTLRSLGVQLALGGHDDATFAGADRIVMSPGVPPLSAVERAAERGVPVWSEVELAARFLRGTLLAVTGTNGKSTVTSMVSAIAQAANLPVFSGGNLGTPLVDAVGSEADASGWVVAEVSSFQLERVDRFRPRVAALLNVSEDHLDRYDSYAAYAAAKGRIFAGQTRQDHAVVPAGDEVCQSLARMGAASVATFGTGGAVAVAGDALRDQVSGLEVPVSGLQVGGGPNLANACAAMLMARLAGASSTAIGEGLTGFRGLPHRMNRVGQVAGVAYFDDSKATNVGAAVAAVRGLAGVCERVVLIAGGRDKGGTYAPLVQALAEHGRGVVLIGEAAGLIDAAVDGALPTQRASSLEEAVEAAAGMARRGDAVLLAPACSSYDMFRSYAERGERFEAAVRARAEREER